MERGYDSERGQRALRRMNQLTAASPSPIDDFLYVLSTFVFEPIRWNERFGWRRHVRERRGCFYFWREVGGRMNIRDIPADYAGFEHFNLDYEARHCRYSEANQRVGSATRELMVSWFPRFLAPLVRSAIYSLLDSRALAAFGFPQPSGTVRWLMIRALRLRGWCASYFSGGLRPRLRTEMVHRSYPAGYRIEDLGPPRK